MCVRGCTCTCVHGFVYVYKYVQVCMCLLTCRVVRSDGLLLQSIQLACPQRHGRMHSRVSGSPVTLSRFTVTKIKCTLRQKGLCFGRGETNLIAQIVSRNRCKPVGQWEKFNIRTTSKTFLPQILLSKIT